jgi:L-fuconolactonase
MATDRIDAHHHLWIYRAEEFPWIGENMQVLARNFSLDDLRQEFAAAGIHGGVAVQARQSVEETNWLLSLAKQSDLLRGVVGWAPICSKDFPHILERLLEERKLVGLRHVIQDELDDNFILQDEFNEGIQRLSDTRLTYDVLIYERHLPAAISFVDRHPNQVFILNHLAKPLIRDRILDPWRLNIRELAKRDNVYCKISGMVTEARWTNWTIQDLAPYFDVVLEAFGPARLLAGSDWPVCRLACSYERWFSVLAELTKNLSPDEQSSIFGGVATNVYSLAPATQRCAS